MFITSSKSATLGVSEGCGDKILVRKRGLERNTSGFNGLDASAPTMDIPGQNGTQPGQFQEVNEDVRFCDRTETHLCQTCEDICATTKNAQGLHKIRTRVLLNSSDESNGDLYRLMTAWPHLPIFVKDAIMALVITNTQAKGKNNAS